VISAILLFAALQDPAVPRAYDVDPRTVATYHVFDVRADKKNPPKIDEFVVFGSELREPGFERFTRYRMDEIAREFLFVLPPAAVKQGDSWEVDWSIAAAGLRYAPVKLEALVPRVRGTYKLVGIDRLEEGAYWLIRGKLDIEEGRTVTIDVASQAKKLGAQGRVVDRKRKIGRIECELRVQPKTGLLQEAAFWFTIDGPDYATRIDDRGSTAQVHAAKGYEFDHRVRLAGTRLLDAKALRAEIKSASKRGFEWLIEQQRANGDFKGLQTNWRYPFIAQAARAFRACGHGGDHPSQKAILDDIRNMPTYKGGLQEALGSHAGLFFATDPDMRLCDWPLEKLPVPRERMAVADSLALDYGVRRLVSGQENKHGMWSGHYLLASPESLHIQPSAVVATSLHYAARLGWKVDPDVWKTIVKTLHETAMEVDASVVMRLTFTADSPYKALLVSRSRTLVWPVLPALPQEKERPHGVPAVTSAMTMLAIARVELKLAGALDAATEKMLDECQRGGLAWISANFTARWVDPDAFVGHPSRDWGAAAVQVLTLYGIEKAGEHDAFEEIATLLLAAQKKEGGWGLGFGRDRAWFGATTPALVALNRFYTRGWAGP